MANKTKNKPSILQLSGSLRIQDASDAHEKIIEYLEKESSPTIDLSSIESIDTIGTQLLISTASGKEVHWLNAPSCLEAHCEAIGYEFEKFTKSKSK